MIKWHIPLLVACLFVFGGNAFADKTPVEVWYTYIADSEEEQLFFRAIEAFEQNNQDIDVNPVRVPYLQMLQQFITASQGGEAPDLVRLNSRDLGKIGQVRVNGAPLLEDLRPHLTPMERSRIDVRAMNAMRYNHALYSLPVSQASLSLIYNKDIFDAHGLPYPQDDWSIDDMLKVAQLLTKGEVRGLAVPIRVYYWWIAFQTGFGGWLFDGDGNPTLNSVGSAEALQWVLDLELKHGVVAPGTGFDVEAVKTQFQQGKAAMTIDGPWNWKSYTDAGLNLGQALLPTVPQSGKRMSPLLAYIGWSISKQSPNKVATARLAKWLASDTVQRTFALQTYTPPTSVSLKDDPAITGDLNLSGFIRQTEVATPAPTTQAMSLAYEPLNTAIELVYTGKMNPAAALSAANDNLASNLER
ncbi:extracellular solute-binding protein [Pseudomaricurvus alkylphenolicus]|uniref:sugar ABC transporter substrate-binding protein n=1 Tax=Pseudomaricurvus alkylphenolicus TaxID=1306991 RepID=UPI001424A55A|nr:extracellular solute-binding protein [Pseudomaricurvus alkylphenolicus]NIB38231.1 extracellular solute-binding protein [Pseudomaricurvus alkylphenolicus]